MRKILVAAVAALGLIGAAPQVTWAADPAPAAAPADAATARKLVLVKRYFVATHVNAMMSQMMKSMIPAMLEQQRKTHPEISESAAQAGSGAVVEAMDDFMPRYMDRVAVVYANAFTEDELTKLVAFYESPVGQSVTAKMPALIPQVTQIMIEMMPDLQREVMAKICSQTACTPATNPASGN